MRRSGAVALFAGMLCTLGARTIQDGREPLASALIDRHIDARLREFRATASPRSSTEEFLRRLYLDLIGVIPTADEVRGFLPSRDPRKRERLVEDLITSRRFAYHWSVVWTSMLVGEDARRDGTARQYIEPFRAWLQEQFHANRPFDAIVRDMVTAEGRVDQRPEVFYLAQNLFKDEGHLDAAQDISQHFLGVRISCARCHDHPFARWTQRNFYETAAFLSRTHLRRVQEENRTIFEVREGPARPVRLPGSDARISPRLLDEWAPESGRALRAELARLLTMQENLQFARAVVNRAWAWFFGRGLVHPADNFDDSNPASHPELLDELARAFIRSGYDTRWLVRSIVLSQAYQRSSQIRSREPPDPRAFASYEMKPLLPSQIADSLLRIAGYSDFVLRYGDRPEVGRDETRRNLEDLFRVDIEDPSLYKVNVQQALAMMNSGLVHRLISCSMDGGLVWRIRQGAPGSQRTIEELYVHILSRFPTPAEVRMHMGYVQRRGGAPEAFEDVAWALLNSSEFIFNH
jgi:hypothetical protein